MKYIVLILFYLLVVLKLTKAQPKDSSKNYLSIGIPQSSGLISASFEYFRVMNDSLYVLYKVNSLMDTSGKYHFIRSYPLDIESLVQLDSLLGQTDSLGDHTSGIFILGWPRFTIHAKHKGKEMYGYVANCYREHIFVFVDWLNALFPEEDIISYDKEDLIAKEEIREN